MLIGMSTSDLAILLPACAAAWILATKKPLAAQRVSGCGHSHPESVEAPNVRRIAVEQEPRSPAR